MALARRAEAGRQVDPGHVWEVRWEQALLERVGDLFGRLLGAPALAYDRREDEGADAGHSDEGLRQEKPVVGGGARVRGPSRQAPATPHRVPTSEARGGVGRSEIKAGDDQIDLRAAADADSSSGRAQNGAELTTRDRRGDRLTRQAHSTATDERPRALCRTNG